jgi:N-acetylneuraminic acid mutarotase
VSEIAVAELGGKVYVLGGYTAETTSSTFNQVYDPATNTWEELAPMHRGLNYIGVAGYDRKICAIGGFAGGGVEAVASFYAYDVAPDVWEELAPLPAPRGSVAVARLGNRIHAIGGRDVVDVNTHEAYDPATGIREKLAPLPTAREHMPAVALDGKIHVSGGRFETIEHNTDLA